MIHTSIQEIQDFRTKPSVYKIEHFFLYPLTLYNKGSYFGVTKVLLRYANWTLI